MMIRRIAGSNGLAQYTKVPPVGKTAFTGDPALETASRRSRFHDLQVHRNGGAFPKAIQAVRECQSSLILERKRPIKIRPVHAEKDRHMAISKPSRLWISCLDLGIHVRL